MKPSEYLDMTMKEKGLKNDNQIRLAMNWSMSKVNNYRHNRQGLDNETSRQVATELNIPVIAVIADMEAFRAKRKKDIKAEKAWKQLAKLSQEKGMASVKLLTIIPFSAFIMHLFYILC